MKPEQEERKEEPDTMTAVAGKTRVYLHDRILGTLEEQGLMQQDISIATGLSKGRVSRLVNGIHSPSIESVVAIADLLNVSIDYLVGRTVQPRLDSERDNMAYLLGRAVERCSDRDLKIVMAVLGEYLTASERDYNENSLKKSNT